MERVVKKLRHDRKVVFDTGRFDDWCVYVVEKDGRRKAPFDTSYFTDLKNIAAHYPQDKVYHDFLKIYKNTDKNIDPTILKIIDERVTTYKPEHQKIIEQWWAVIYAGMIAEENKQFAILKKRIKHLGIYQVLKLGYSSDKAANFSKGKKWRELDAIMKPLGI